MGKTAVIATAVEIGTSQISILVGEVTGDSVTVIGRGTAPSGEAMRKGEIRDMELISKAFEQAMAQADESSGGAVLGSAIVTQVISGGGVICTTGVGTASVRNEAGIVGEAEMNEARCNAQVIEITPGWQIINTDDIFWRLDGRPVGHPLNQRGRKLEVQVLIVLAPAAQVANFSDLIRNSELLNAKLYNAYAPICAKEGTLTDKEADDGAVLIDLGAGCTDYLVARDGGMVEAGTLQIGFDHVANDLAIGLGLSFGVCRKLLESGAVKTAIEQESPALMIQLPNGGPQEIPISRFEAIINPRLQEIFEQVRKHIRTQGALFSGVLTGGGALHPGALELFSKTFNLPCRVGTVADATGSITGLDSPRCTTVWGALKIAAYYYRSFSAGKGGSAFQRFLEGMNNIWIFLPRWAGKLWKAFKF